MKSVVSNKKSLAITNRSPCFCYPTKINKNHHVMTQMICSSSVGRPNTLYYASRPVYDDNIIQILVEQKTRDIEPNVYSSTILCRRAVVVRTRRGDYACPEPIETSTIALLLKTLGSSIDGALVSQMRSCLKSFAEDEPWCRERMEIVRQICATAEASQCCDVRPRAHPDLSRYRHRTSVVAPAPLADSDDIKASTLLSSSVVIAATTTLAKRVSKSVQRYKPRSRTSPKKDISK